MTMRFQPVEDTAADMLNTAAPGEIGLRSAGAVASGGVGSGRVIRYVFSDPSVARDNHIIKAGAWELTNFLRNPVFLWAHDQDSPPIGRVTEIAERGSQLVGAVEYLDRDISPFADAIYQMTRGGFLNATSVSWLPVEWKYSGDRSRPGGVDFSRVELLEISQVPVPALPTALATARSRGIDTAPIFEWATRMLDSGGFSALPRDELEALRKEARMPSPARKIEAEPVAALVIEPVAEPAPKIPLAVTLRSSAAEARKRGLYELSMLCELVSYADYVCCSIEREAIEEGDGSAVPAQMRAWIDEGNRIIAAMANEETAENISGTQDVERAVEAAVKRALAGVGFVREGKPPEL